MPDSDIKFRVSQEGAEKTAQDFQEIDGSLYDMQKAGSAATRALANFNEVMRNSEPTSRAYLLAQENRNAILSALPRIQRIGTDETIKSIEATKTSTRGLGTLAAQMLSTSSGSSALTSQVSIMTTALIGGTGLTAGLALVVGAFTLFAKKVGESREELEKITEATKRLIRVQTTKGAFDVLPEKIPEAIKLLRKELEMIPAEGFMGLMNRQDITSLKAGIETLKEAEKEERNRLRIMELLTNAGLVYTEETEKKTREDKKGTGAIKEMTKALNELYKELIKVLSAGAPPRGDIRFRGLVKGVPVPEKPKIEFSKEEEEYFNRVNDMAMITAGVLRDEFTKAWQDVFGEANSLFEKFAMRISEYFAELALRYAAMGLFNFLFPGAGTVAGMATSAVSGGATLDKSINIILDGEVVGTFIDNRVPYSVSKATRLSIL